MEKAFHLCIYNDYVSSFFILVDFVGLSGILRTLETAMTDGPFKNSDLSARWKRYGKDLVNDATSQDERSAQMCVSVLGDLDLKTVSAILGELRVHFEQGQMAFDPMESVRGILDKYDKSPAADLLERSLRVQLREQPSGTAALNEAVNEMRNELLNIAKNRIDEECIRARDIGDMSQESYRKALDRNRETANAVNRDALRDALFSGKKDAFKRAAENKKDVDEGPDE